MSSKRSNSELAQIQKEIAKIRTRRDKLDMTLDGLKDQETRLALTNLPIQQLTYVAGLLKQQAFIQARLNSLCLPRNVCFKYHIKVLSCSRRGCDLSALTYVPEDSARRELMKEYTLEGWQCVSEDKILCPEHTEAWYEGQIQENLYVRKN